MIKKFFAIAFILLLGVTAKAAIGDWQLHTSYCDATYCQIVGSKIYVLASGSLFTYDKEDGEVYTYDRINELSDYDITHIAYCKEIEALMKRIRCSSGLPSIRATASFSSPPKTSGVGSMTGSQG